MRLAFAFSLSLLIALSAGAQNLPIPAMPFLEIPPSPVVNAMGGAGVARTAPDPHGFLYNPAQLGIAARDSRAAGTLYPGGSVDWLSVGELSVGSAALTAGLDLNAAIVPLSLGIGLAQTALNFTDRVLVDEAGEPVASYRPRDSYRALSVGAATRGAARIGVGVTGRHVRSTDRAELNADQAIVSTISGFTFDLGILAEADVTEIFGSPSLGSVRPHFAVSAGYSQTNIGGEVAYTGQIVRSALPRTARIGWAAEVGLDIPLNNRQFRFIQADVSVQAEHLLARRGANGSLHYENLLGSLNVFDNGLLGNGDEDVTGRKGMRIELLETFTLSRGGFDGWGFNEARTSGIEISLTGPLKIAAAISGSSAVTEFVDRYDLRFTHSTYFEGGLNESTFSGLTFVVKR